jgi:AcrR family transcriptional regulator
MSATRKRPPARAPEETRAKLVEAAGKLFNSVGYFGTDSNRIAREAGYAPGTFYVHFADKREIFLEVYRGWVDSEWRAIAAAIAPEKGAGARSPSLRSPSLRSPSLRSQSLRSQSLRIAQAVLRHHREWRMFRKSLRALTVTDERVHQARVAQRARQIAQTAELLKARGVTQTPARIYANLLLFEILCDAVADGDTATLGLKERDILARLAADVDALLEPGRTSSRFSRAKSRGKSG